MNSDLSTDEEKLQFRDLDMFRIWVFPFTTSLLTWTPIYIEHKEVFSQKEATIPNPKQNPREKASFCCSTSTLRPERRRSIFRAELKSPWLREVGVVERRPVRTSRVVRSEWSSRPQHRRVLYFPHRRLWILECSCKTQAHTQAALQAQLEAQEGDMEQYLEEKKASQKRPATTFQQQDKKKVVYQTQQRSVAVGSTQAASGDPLLLGGSLDVGEGYPKTGLKLASTENQEEGTFGGFLGLPKESFNDPFDPFEDLIRGK
ncbi:hypothetical protein Taro_008462 [Colocasia esculenta]|uniref:Uncharacterized protein n=1 Tax=Colocasia esculenta TaxID=4460 RepID=A0A843U157_COLES|nr:hypothetical protein [Colocasia esculenta]